MSAMTKKEVVHKNKQKNTTSEGGGKLLRLLHYAIQFIRCAQKNASLIIFFVRQFIYLKNCKGREVK
jgi:hypothetical protein